MAMTPQEELVSRVILREGGVKDIDDGKGVTRWGQIPDWLEQFGLPIPQNEVEATQNYLTWMAITGLDKIASVADDLADIVLDIAVMSDHRKAIKALQASMHVQVDGVVGTRTLAVLATVDRKKMAREVIAWDMTYQGYLITRDSARAKWAAGWASRMAVHVRQLK